MPTGSVESWAALPGPQWWRRTRSVIALAAIVYGTVSTRPYPAHTRAEYALLILLVLASAAWIVFTFAPDDRPGLVIAAIVVCGTAGMAISWMSPHSPALAFVAAAVIRAVVWWPSWSWGGFAFGLGLGCAMGGVVAHRSLLVTLLGPVVVLGSVAVGLIRRQAVELAAEAQFVREEQARSAALDERARIAREIHDVLAHSLAALTLQLDAADALLESGRSDQAHQFVRRAAHLAREGQAETRRAIGALRGDTLPLPDLLRTLAAAYSADFGAGADVRVDGDERSLRPDVGLAFYRSAQEALTNVRKHAPGAVVAIALEYGPDDVALTVRNGEAPSGERPLAAAGGGYGLTGLRERAELAGGMLTAGPADDGPDRGGWVVDVRIPA